MIRNLGTDISEAILNARKHHEEVVLELEKKIMSKMADEKVNVDASTQTDDRTKENVDEEVKVDEDKSEGTTKASKCSSADSKKATAPSEDPKKKKSEEATNASKVSATANKKQMLPMKRITYCL